ncbi:MAG: tRNA (5-methylaminomethyl-2-thiouridine)(34)-methyltransferase MnmD [Pseudomonadota bacterium]
MTDLEWRDDNLPVSTRFDDPYYSRHDGRAETAHVFIDGNDLPSRWKAQKTCTICELGFGTGLNFLETVRQWQLHKPDDASLHFISFEQFPISVDDMERALSNWTELEELKNRLGSIWESQTGSIDTDFSGDIRLTVHMGDANQLLPKSRFMADALYLDGFSPAKNPELWNETLMREIADRTVAGGTVATYTSAGFVRRNLQDAGFRMSKIKGFGSKREMLAGFKQGDIDVADRY